MTVLAAASWPTNADLIADVARLYYRGGEVCDPTYGRGLWWTKFQPAVLIRSDVAAKGQTVAAHDFTRLPYESGRFAVVAFDPPYVCTGGRETSTLPDFNDRYGLVDTPRTPGALVAQNIAGLAECARVVQPGGTIWLKSMDYIWSGRLQPVTHLMICAGLELGLQLEDRFEHVGHVRAQPLDGKCRACDGEGVTPFERLTLPQRREWQAGPLPRLVACEPCGGTGRIARRVAHARRNLSTLLVFRRPRAPRRSAAVAGVLL